MAPEKICSVCEIPIKENYCGRCGQTFSGKTTSTVSLITDFISNFLSMEKSGFATLLKILKNPKPIVDNYYLGYKNYYASPGKILLYGIAVVALHLSFVHEKVMGVSLGSENVNAQYLFWIMLFPILLFISYMTFIRVEKGLSKHLISLIYITSPLFIVLTILNDLVIIISGDKLGIWAFVLFVSLVFFWNSRVFTTSKKHVFIVLNTFIQMVIFFGLITFLVLITNQINNP